MKKFKVSGACCVEMAIALAVRATAAVMAVSMEDKVIAMNIDVYSDSTTPIA